MRARIHLLVPAAVLAAMLVLSHARGDAAVDNALSSMPPGYELQFYDDCGLADRQPHIVRAEDTYEFPAAQVDADEKARTIAWGWKEVGAAYQGLQPDIDYVLAITYANEPFNNRVQSLWAGDICIHGPHALPRGKAERLLFKVPREAIKGGKLQLQFKLEAQVNVVVSVIELWAPLPGRKALYLDPMAALLSDLEGRVLDEKWDPAAGVRVALQRKGGTTEIATAQSGADGRFSFSRATFAGKQPASDLEVVATHGGLTALRTVAAEDLTYEPIRYHPIPAREPGLRSVTISLDGEWRIDPKPGKMTRATALDAANWSPFHVPGQFVEQGFDVPQDKPVALARTFDIPVAWKGHRVILRFDAVHAGTRYFVNGTLVGTSENLFTPVELDITDAAHIGGGNRLDLEMTVDTLSERLSYSSGYAFHNLGGIDRSVRLFALPLVHVKDLRLLQDLDEDYRDARLTVQLGLANATGDTAGDLRVEMRLFAPDGTEARPATTGGDVGTVLASGREVTINADVPNPVKWNAEKPALYRLVIDLKQGRKTLERIERNVGFRKIEARNGQVYVNGVRIKLTGACHHETDPLTGRADTARHAETDVRLMKAANLNFIRTSHYPPVQELLDAADRIGMYVEVEAPFCWVGNDQNASHLRAILNPTSAMIDYHHAHPSVIWWSLANESEFNPLFEQSAKLCAELDATRPTTFNNPDPKRICGIANLHYPGMPYDDNLRDDPRPIFLGEYFFPICHEQTDVRIDPGLRELWGAGHSDSDSDWGKECAKGFYGGPGAVPGTWSYIVRLNRIVGGSIWAALDDAFYLPGGKQVGYAWHHGFWGLIDAWRRPKPEWWLSKQIFSPVWFSTRQVPFVPGAETIGVPVENRYSFTSFSELHFTWKAKGQTGAIVADVPPGGKGELTIPLPRGMAEGDTVLVRATDSRGAVVTEAAIQLGQRPARKLPTPSAGAPRWTDDGKTITVEGDTFCLVLDRATGQLKPTDPRHRSAVVQFPSVHATRFDFGDLRGPDSPPYAVFPDPKTRVVDEVTVSEKAGVLELAVRDHYEGFAGTVGWLLDRAGMGRVSVDYAHTGPDFDARELGVRFLLKPGCERLTWRRWSEWAGYPEDSVSRTEGTAVAHRDPALGPGDERTPPRWPWSLDETELGSTDFRSVKLNVYDATLSAPDGQRLAIHADADRHARACLDPAGVTLHVLTDCRMGPVTVRKGDHIRGEFVVEMVGK